MLIPALAAAGSRDNLTGMKDGVSQDEGGRLPG
jgi:hypothetical protein